MSNFDGYITDVDELYIFAKSVDRFCGEFHQGCINIANATEQDKSMGGNEISRLEERVSRFEAEVNSRESDYSSYIAHKNYDPEVARQLKEKIRQTKEKLNRAQEDLRDGKRIFKQLFLNLDELRSTAQTESHEICDMGADAVRVIKSAAQIIEHNYKC